MCFFLFFSNNFQTTQIVVHPLEHIISLRHFISDETHLTKAFLCRDDTPGMLHPYSFTPFITHPHAFPDQGHDLVVCICLSH